MRTDTSTLNWPRLKAFFRKACSLGEMQRAQMMDALRLRDPLLAGELAALFSDLAEVGDFLEASEGATQDVIQQPAEVGEGMFEIIEPLGRGGMGTVYLARQKEPVRRNVALKIFDERYSGRFKHEQQILARLEHPHIARFYHGGLTRDGRAYMAMELLQGMPLIDYGERHGLSIEQRIELFLQVCRAVAYSHGKGVVHRDLKPSNILVTDGPEGPCAKVIDFGIAKSLVLEQESRELTDGQLMGTPNYMSPEQAGLHGRRIDYYTDIYALGVLLFQLLTGTVPFDFQGKSSDQVLRVLEQDVAPKASEILLKTGNWKWGYLVAGELDQVVSRALEKEPALRYKNIEHMIRDLSAISCRSKLWNIARSWLYRGKRHCQTQAAGMVALLVVFGGILWFVQNEKRYSGQQQITAWAGYLELEHELEKARLLPLHNVGAQRETLARYQRGLMRKENSAEQTGLIDHINGRYYLQTGRYGLAKAYLDRVLDLDEGKRGARQDWLWAQLWPWLFQLLSKRDGVLPQSPSLTDHSSQESDIVGRWANGHYDDALVQLERLIQQQPHRYELSIMRACLHSYQARSGRIEESRRAFQHAELAERDFEKVLEIARSDVRVYRLYASHCHQMYGWLREQGNADYRLYAQRALDLARRGTLVHPGDVGLQNLIAELSPAMTHESGDDCVPVATGLEMNLWFAFDEARKDVVYDRSGKGHRGQLLPVGRGPAVEDHALVFNGSDQFVSLPDDSTLRLAEASFSLEIWIKPRHLFGVQTMLEKRTLEPVVGYSMFLFGGQPGFQLATMEGYTNYLSSTTLERDVWTHLVVAVQPGEMKSFLFVNGNLDLAFTRREGAIMNDEPIWIGKHQEGSLYFNGAIDDLIFYRRALTAEEAATHYRAGRNGKCRNNLPPKKP